MLGSYLCNLIAEAPVRFKSDLSKSISYDFKISRDLMVRRLPIWSGYNLPLYMMTSSHGNIFRVNTLRPRQNGRHFAEDTFNHIFVNENARISIEFSLKFVPNGPINNIPALVRIMAWRRPGDKPLSEPVMVSLLTHICGTRPQWVDGPLWG